MSGMLDKLLKDAEDKGLSVELVKVVATFKASGEEYDVPFTAGMTIEEFSKGLFGKIESAPKRVTAPRGAKRPRLSTAPVVGDPEGKARAQGWPEDSIKEFKDNNQAMKTMSEENFRSNGRFLGLSGDDLSYAIREYFS